jgi:hypothetical protein
MISLVNWNILLRLSELSAPTILIAVTHLASNVWIFTNNIIDIIRKELFKMHQSGSRGPTGGSIQFRLHYLPDASSLDENVIERANESVQGMRSAGTLIRTSKGIFSLVKKGTDMADTINNLWGSLFQNVASFVKFVDILADVNL